MLMSPVVLPLPLQARDPMTELADLARWLGAHRSAIVVAGLLAFAIPLTSVVSALGVAPELTLARMFAGTLRALVFGLANFGAFLLAGYVLVRLELRGWRASVAALALGACAVVPSASIAYFTEWADMVEATGPGFGFAADTFAQNLSTALIFFAHLQHSRVHERAAERLSAAKQLQREARRRLAQSHLQAVQARIEPQLLFDMLDAVRRAYESEPPRAEQLLDQLVVFLRAALPRLQHASSSVPREAELARACATLHTLAGTSRVGLSLDVPAEMMDARFPPGVLLPILDEALRGHGGACAIGAKRDGAATEVALTLPSSPSPATLDRVRALLNDLYGNAAELCVASARATSRVIVRVPYEPA